MGAGWAAAAFCARCSNVARIGLVGRLARAPSPRWRPRARSSLPLCSRALRCVLVSPQSNGSQQKSFTSLHFLQDIDPLAHGTRATTARPHLLRIFRGFTCSQPTIPLSLAETTAMDADGGADGPQSARARQPRVTGDHAVSYRHHQWYRGGRRSSWGLAPWIALLPFLFMYVNLR